jgi:hypothetical protein
MSNSEENRLDRLETLALGETIVQGLREILAIATSNARAIEAFIPTFEKVVFIGVYETKPLVTTPFPLRKPRRT